MTCHPCTLRAAGNTTAADALETIRAQRIILAALNGAGDAVEETATELGRCQDCIGRLAAIYLGMTISYLTAYCGGNTETAAQAISQGLLTDLDTPPGGRSPS